jgi:hypothetical protein
MTVSEDFHMQLELRAPPDKVVSGSLSRAKCPSLAPFSAGGKTTTSSATSFSRP